MFMRYDFGAKLQKNYVKQAFVVTLLIIDF